MSGGVLVFRYASHSGVSSGWSSMDTGSSRGAAAAEGDKRDDGVASIGDRTGVTTGALNFGANVSRKSCSQPGSAVTSGVIRGTVVAGLGILTGVGVGGARGMSSGRSVPGLYEFVGVGALPALDTGEVLDLDRCFISMTGAPTNGCKSPWMALKHLIRGSNLPRSIAVKSAGYAVSLPLMRPSRCTRLKNPRRNFRGNLPCFALKATAALANRTSPLIRVCSFWSKVCAQCVFLVRAHAAKISESAGSSEVSQEDAISGLSKSTVVALILLLRVGRCSGAFLFPRSKILTRSSAAMSSLLIHWSWAGE